MGLYMGKQLQNAFEDGKIGHPSHAILYVDYVCDKCGANTDYAHWSSCGKACRKCGHKAEV